MCAEAAHEIVPGGQAPPTRPPRALVVFDPPPEEIGAKIDWSPWYLTDEDDMGQNPEQTDCIDVFESSAKMLARERSWTGIRIGIDEFFAWIAEEPLVRISPDVFVLDDPPAKPYPPLWETWKPGINPPRFALEVVSSDWKKDYQDIPPKYAQLGSSELVIFDPKAARGETADPRRVALQVFRREADGAFVRVRSGGRIARSDELDAWVVVTLEGSGAFLRIARDPEGLDLLPTHEEALDEAERQKAEEQQARHQAEWRQAEEQRARREAERQKAEAERQKAEAEQRQAEAEQKLTEERNRLILRLDRRFGPLSPDQLRQLGELDGETLLDSLLTAGSLDEVPGLSV
jgi:hypothetical protein